MEWSQSDLNQTQIEEQKQREIGDKEQQKGVKEQQSGKIYVGWIVLVDPKMDQVWVDFQGNPTGKPLLAKLGRPFYLDDLKRAQEQVQDVRLEFVGNEVRIPVIQDIYYSILKRAEQEDNVPQKDLYLKGRRIVLEGTEQIILKSGETVTIYDGKSGQISAKARTMVSTASLKNRIRAGHLSLN